MKHVKMLGLLVMAAASLMAFASSASANPVLTSTAGVEYTGEIKATIPSGSSALLEAGIKDTCTTSTAAGTVTTNNTEHAKGALSTLTFENCTQDTTVINKGSLTINDKGEVFAIGNRVEVKVTSLGISCFYGGAEGAGTKIGTLTTGTPAKLAISTTELPRQSGSSTFFCAEKGTWTGNYTVTTPESLFIT